MSTRILVCGGRDFTDRDLVIAALYRYAPHSEPDADGNTMPKDVTIIHGACPTGADQFADDWAVVNWCPVEAFPADWATFGRSAGPRRNTNMLVEGRPDFVLAFLGGRGTKNMVDQARARRVPVIEPSWMSLFGPE